MAEHVRVSEKLMVAWKWLSKLEIGHVRRFSTYTQSIAVRGGGGYVWEEAIDSDSVSVRHTDREHLLGVLDEGRRQGWPGLQVFLGESQRIHAKNPWRQITLEQLVIKPLRDEFAIAEYRGVTDPEEGLSNADIVEEIRALKEMSGLQIVGADRATVWIRTPDPDRVTQAFVDRLLSFCPDILQGIRQDEVLGFMRNGGLIPLWWD